MTLPAFATQDPWLTPYHTLLTAQVEHLDRYETRLLNGKQLEEFALGYCYFGLHQTSNGWVFREWAPQATAMYLLSEATNWKDQASHRLTQLSDGIWELYLPASALMHGDHYKLHIHWPGGSGERLPSYVPYAVQDPQTKIFDAVVWEPAQPYSWQHTTPARPSVSLIYEAHIGMSSEAPEVASYTYFTDNILPRIATLGYTTVQLMGIQEHPYYGSFGYHVSNFFAASSRFGTPDDLKRLIDTAHGLGLTVIMDIVHSHAVKNETEGLSRFDGTLTQYFHHGERGNHQAWDSRTFDYGKSEVAHFLLSNIRFWLDEYHFDGFRFDGVTSMLYHDHGLERSFDSYDEYFSGNIDLDALAYLRLANTLAHQRQPATLTIAEDTSGFPGLAAPRSLGGVGFDARLSMGIADLWIKLLKEQQDEDWDLGALFHELTNHRAEETTISYAESHDQALVGDKALIFHLIDQAMYDHMQTDDNSLAVERGIALHKIIRLLTASTHAGGYLTFMGNEFGHPEWIDFPRQGNNWSYTYARRQWSLADNQNLKYQWLQNFDIAMIALVAKLTLSDYHFVTIDQERHVLSYQRGDYVFIYNLSPNKSHSDYAVPVQNGDYQLVLSSDDPQFGGQGRVIKNAPYHATNQQLQVYLPNRTALVFRARANPKT